VVLDAEFIPSVEKKCKTDDMLIILGVNLYPWVIKDVISGLRSRIIGEIEI